MARDRWTGKGHDLRWSDAANWSTGVPAAAQDVVFSGSATLTLDLAGVAPQLGQLTILGDALTVPGARINLDAAQPKHGVASDLVLGRGGSLSLTNDSILAATNIIQIGAFTGGTLSAGTLSVSALSGGWSDGLQIYDGLFSLSGPQVEWGFSGFGTDFSAQVGGPGTTELLISGGATLNPQGAPNSYLYIGDVGTGDGQVAVTGAGSNLSIGQIYAGDGYSGTLTVANGAVVNTGGLFAGEFGDGTVTVTSGAVLAAAYGVIVGGEVPVSSSLNITNHGSVYAGTNGLVLEEGTLSLDPTATLFGTIESLGGRIDAQAQAGPHHGTVTVGQTVFLGDWSPDLQFGDVTDVSSSGGAVLNFAGQIQAVDTTSVLAVTAGTVVLSNAQNILNDVAAYAGTLVIAVNGALGTGTLSFLFPGTSENGTATVVVDKGVKLGNAIADIGNNDTIDLKGFSFAGGVTDSYASGTLTLHNGTSSTSLLFTGGNDSGTFTFSEDTQGGTVLHFQPS